MPETRSEQALLQDRRWAETVASWRDGSPPSFDEQRVLWKEIFTGRYPEDGPPVAWIPGGEGDPPATNVGHWLASHGWSDYEELRRWSIDDPSGFWAEAIERLGIDFDTPAVPLSANADPRDPGWFSGARLDVVDSCFAASSPAPAIVVGGEGRTDVTFVSRPELEGLVDRVAAGLRASGVASGTRIGICMPMTVECVAVYLGIVRAGVSAVAIADSFSAEEIGSRMEIAEAEWIVTVDHFMRAGKRIDLFERVRAAGPWPAIVIGVEAPVLSPDVSWDDLLTRGDEALARDRTAGPTPEAQDEITVLFSSGTTGTPKAIAWNHLTPLKGVLDAHVHQDVQPGDVVAWPTNLGWMMGPWLIFASLVNGATIALFDGAPNGREFVDFVQRARVTVLGVVPALVRAWRAAEFSETVWWPEVRVISTTGEPSHVEDYLWLMSRTGYRAPVIEYIGGTELGGGYMAGLVTRPASPGTFNAQALGVELVIRTDAGELISPAELEAGVSGEVFLRPPAVGLSERLLNADHDAVYHAGCPRKDAVLLRRHGDRIRSAGQGFWRADGRVDDAMNLGGIKVGSLEIENVLQALPGIGACAAVGITPPGGGGARLVVFCVPERDQRVPSLDVMNRALAERLNPLFRIYDAQVVESLPRTASNKLRRRALADSYDSSGG